MIIQFITNQSQKINLNIFDAQGTLINRVINRYLQPGDIQSNGTEQRDIIQELHQDYISFSYRVIIKLS